MPQIERQVRQNFISNALGWFKNLFSRPNWWMWTIGTRQVMPDMDQTKAIEEGFNANGAVYSIVKTDANKFASIPRYVYDAKSYTKKESRRMPSHLKVVSGATVLKNDLSKLLERPNPYQGQAAFFKTVRSYYKVEGEGFIWLNRGDMTDREGNPLSDLIQDTKPVLEMYPLPVDMMDVVPDPENFYGVAGYILKVAGVDYPLRKNDVIHWKDINLKWDASTREHLRGMTPLKPGSLTLQQSNEIAKSATRMYQNDGAKGILYGEEERGMTSTQESQIRSVVDKKVNNNDIKGAVASIFGMGKLGYLDVGQTSVDLDLLQAKKATWQELCALFEVPPEFYNTETAFANKEWAQKNWVSNSIIPASKELDDELNRQLLRAFGLEGIGIIACDYSELPELQANMKELADWLLVAYWIYPNEKREIMGFEKGPVEFDEPWMPSGLTPLSQMNEPDPLGDLGLSDYSVPPPKTTQTQEAA